MIHGRDVSHPVRPCDQSRTWRPGNYRDRGDLVFHRLVVHFLVSMVERALKFGVEWSEIVVLVVVQ